LKPVSVYADYAQQLTYIIQKYNLDIDKIGHVKAHAGCFNYKKITY